MRYRIKARLADLQMTSKELIDELSKRGYKVDTADFSNYINGKKQGVTADRITAEADKILQEKEGKKI